MATHTDTVTYYNIEWYVLKNVPYYKSVCESENFANLSSGFYYEQQKEINGLRRKENNLLDEASRIRRKMHELESLPEKSDEWHQLEIKLNRVETELIRINDQINTLGIV
jgi:DNA repair ATPase RecN